MEQEEFYPLGNRPNWMAPNEKTSLLNSRKQLKIFKQNPKNTLLNPP